MIPKHVKIDTEFGPVLVWSNGYYDGKLSIAARTDADEGCPFIVVNGVEYRVRMDAYIHADGTFECSGYGNKGHLFLDRYNWDPKKSTTDSARNKVRNILQVHLQDYARNNPQDIYETEVGKAEEARDAAFKALGDAQKGVEEAQENLLKAQQRLAVLRSR